MLDSTRKGQERDVYILAIDWCKSGPRPGYIMVEEVWKVRVSTNYGSPYGVLSRLGYDTHPHSRVRRIRIREWKKQRSACHNQRTKEELKPREDPRRTTETRNRNLSARDGRKKRCLVFVRPGPAEKRIIFKFWRFSSIIWILYRLNLIMINIK